MDEKPDHHPSKVPSDGTPIEHEMRTKTIPENGTYRVDRMAENGAPVISVDGEEYEAVLGSDRVEAGNFIKVEFDGKTPKIVGVS